VPTVFLWPTALLLLVGFIFGWRRAEHPICVAALCLLQALEEWVDAYSDKNSRAIQELNG
jgi:hypothetical protein